jgi:sigma-B regulation protein RsbU (phosphoserine phosphatase)
MMPVLNGFEALRQLRQTHSQHELPVIMATAKDQASDVVEALKLGANDYVTKPLDFPVVHARVQTQLSLRSAFQQIRHLQEDLRRRNQDLECANRRMKHDLQMAAMVQRSTLPTEIPEFPGLNVAWFYEPCDEIGGDSLNIVPLSDRFVAIYVLDVSGHGVPAALLSVTLSRLLAPARTAAGSVLTAEDSPIAPGITAPSSLARQLNRAYPMNQTTLQYFTLMYGILDLHTQRLHYVSAGHPGFILVRCAPGTSPTATAHEIPGFPIGILDEADYKDHVLQLQPGDRLYLFSDGLADVMNPESECFGPERLRDSAKRACDQSLSDSIHSIVADALTWCNSVTKDDISLLALELTSPVEPPHDPAI